MLHRYHTVFTVGPNVGNTHQRTFYKNGKQISQNTVAFVLSLSSQQFTIGYGTSGTSFLNGNLDEFVLYDTTLTARQAALRYAGDWTSGPALTDVQMWLKVRCMRRRVCIAVNRVSVLTRVCACLAFLLPLSLMMAWVLPLPPTLPVRWSAS